MPEVYNLYVCSMVYCQQCLGQRQQLPLYHSRPSPRTLLLAWRWRATDGPGRSSTSIGDTCSTEASTWSIHNLRLHTTWG
jgi:hypothetical protein